MLFRSVEEWVTDATLMAGSVVTGTLSIVHTGLAGKILTSLADDVGQVAAQGAARVVGGSLSVVFGGLGIFYDVYQLTKNIQELAQAGQCEEIRAIIEQMRNQLMALKEEEEKRSKGGQA